MYALLQVQRESDTNIGNVKGAARAITIVEITSNPFNATFLNFNFL
jgi:hypothetical protein